MKPTDPMKLIVRAYVDGCLLFKEHLDCTADQLTAIAERHVREMAKHERFMLEIEIPELPEEERFLRFGTDPRMMDPTRRY